MDYIKWYIEDIANFYDSHEDGNGTRIREIVQSTPPEVLWTRHPRIRESYQRSLEKLR